MSNLIERVMNRSRSYFRSGSVAKRELYVRGSRLFRAGVVRRRAAAIDPSWPGDMFIDERLGFLTIEPSPADDLVAAAVEEARSDLGHHDWADSRQRKAYLQEVSMRRPLDLRHPYLKLALSPRIASIVSRYMGYVPVLSEILLWYSPNSDGQFAGSQFFHLDHADVRQVKVFLLVNDTDEETGPLTVIRADVGRRISDDIGYKLSAVDVRVPDEIIERYLPTEKHTKAVGKAGTLFLADTSRCFHYGSRGGRKPRTVLIMQYVSPFSFRFSFDFRKDAKFVGVTEEGLPEWQRLLLGNP